MAGETYCRNPNTQRKLELVSSVVTNFALPNERTVSIRCFGILDDEIRACVRRMKEYFSLEGNPPPPGERPINGQEFGIELYIQPKITLSAFRQRQSPAMDVVLVIFVSSSSFGKCKLLRHWISVPSLVRRACVRAWLPCTDTRRSKFLPYIKLTCRLGIRAAWDEDLREREFDNWFYSLDRYTKNLDFPRRVPIGDGLTEGRDEFKRRRYLFKS